jgi:hypothetical protein
MPPPPENNGGGGTYRIEKINFYIKLKSSCMLIHVGCVVDKVALGQVFLRVLRFSESGGLSSRSI